jgi:hypothetical protein
MPNNGLSSIHVSRPSGQYQDSLRAYKIRIDGRVVGKVRRGQSIDYKVTPGRHSVQASLDTAKSKVVEVECSAEGATSLEVRPSAGQPLSKLFTRRKWIELELVSGT